MKRLLYLNEGFEIPLLSPPQTPPKYSRGDYEEVFQSSLIKQPADIPNR